MSSMYPPYSSTSIQRCSRCGTPLPPNEAFCNTCGFYNTVMPSNSPTDQPSPSTGIPWSGSPPQPTYGSAQYNPQQWGQNFVSSAPNAPYAGPSSPQQPFYQNNYNEAASPTFNSNNYYGAPNSVPQQQIYTSPPSSPSGGYAQGSVSGLQPNTYNSQPQKSGPRILLAIGGIILLVILVGVSLLSGYLYLQNQSNNEQSATVTPTIAHPTPSVKPLFSDSFNNNSTGWDLTSSPAKFLVQVGGGRMILEDDDNRLLPEVLPGKSFANFRLTVNAVLSKGDQNNGYGVYIRSATSQTGDLSTYYRFELYGDGSYAVFKGVLDSNGNSQSNKLKGYFSDSAIKKQGGLNQITILAKGSNMSFIVNGKTLVSFSDNFYRSGAVALFVSNLPGSPPGAQATFSNLAIYPD